INMLRGFCREFGLDVPVGAVRGIAQIARFIADDRSAIPAILRTPMRLALEEIRLMEARIEQVERELAEIARGSPACAALTSAPVATSIGSGAGRSPSRTAPTTTRRLARSPTSSRASPGPSGSSTNAIRQRPPEDALKSLSAVCEERHRPSWQQRSDQHGKKPITPLIEA